MSADDTPYTIRDWKPRHQRIEPIPGSQQLLVRVLLVVHRREPGRSALITECLRRDDGAEELVSEGGSALEMCGVTPARCRELFDTVVAVLLPWRGEEDE